jgi:hypothetical protein
MEYRVTDATPFNATVKSKNDSNGCCSLPPPDGPFRCHQPPPKDLNTARPRIRPAYKTLHRKEYAMATCPNDAPRRLYATFVNVHGNKK